MFGIEFKFTNNIPAVKTAADKASFRNITKTAFAIRRTSIESIVPSDEPSAAGTPVHTRIRGVIKSGKNKGKKRLGQVARAITYFADRSALDAVIGPRYSVVGGSMEPHEKGGEYKGERYPKRPTMTPALDKNISLFGNSFSGSLGQQ